MSAILERIKEAYHLKTDAEVAEFLDLKPSTLSMQKNRGRFNLQLIIRKCNDLNKNWLLDGHGKMKKEEMKTGKNRIPVYSSLSLKNHAPDFHRSIKAGSIYTDVTDELQKFAASDHIIGYVVPEDTLAPVIQKDDIAIVNLDYSISDNAICLVSNDNEVNFRRLSGKAGDNLLESDNSVRESSQVQSNQTGSRIVGKLEWVIHRVKG